MGLFPKEQTAEGVALGNVPRRMAWTREQGTRKLLLAFVALLVIWFVVGKVRDHYLLSRAWATLKPDPSGLTIVGTLDSREAYDRNMFRILQANQTSRVEITDFGWRSVFTDADQGLFTDRVGNEIRAAIGMDDETGYAMLTPFLRVGVDRLMGRNDSYQSVTRDYPIVIQKHEGKQVVEETKSLGTLIDKYTGQKNEAATESDASEGGSGSGHEVEHGLALSADTVLGACPVVLTGAQFTDGWLEEHPASVFDTKTYTLHLNLTSEGRSRFFQWSHDHAGESLVFVLNHRVETAGRIQQTLDVNEWEIGPIHDEDAANRLVNYVNKKQP